MQSVIVNFGPFALEITINGEIADALSCQTALRLGYFQMAFKITNRLGNQLDLDTENRCKVNFTPFALAIDTIQTF